MPAALWRLLMLLVCLTGPLAAPATAQEPAELPPPEESTPELFATGLAPACSIAFQHEGIAYLSNYRREGVLGRLLPDGTASVFCDLTEAAALEARPVRIACLRVDVEGRILVADAASGRLLRVSPDGARVEVLADRYEGERFTAVEAVALDRFGDIYFTDRGVETPAEGDSEESEGADGGEPADEAEDLATAGEPAPLGGLYRFDIQTNKVTQLDRGLARPTGLAVSPDQSRLVMAELTSERVYHYLLGRGVVEARQVLIELAEPGGEEGAAALHHAPRGMAFDESGRLYVALSASGYIAVIDVNTGTLLARYEAGGTGANDCHFHAGDLYVAVPTKETVFRLPLGVAGFDYCGQ